MGTAATPSHWRPMCERGVVRAAGKLNLTVRFEGDPIRRRWVVSSKSSGRKLLTFTPGTDRYHGHASGIGNGVAQWWDVLRMAAAHA